MGDHCVLVSSPDGSLLYRVLRMLTCVNILIAVARPFRSLMLWTAGSHVHGMVSIVVLKLKPIFVGVWLYIFIIVSRSSRG